MQAVLSVTEKEINSDLLNVIKSLFSKNVSEIIIKNSEVKLEEFDSSVSIEEIVTQMADCGYSKEFLSDIRNGLEGSSAYQK